MPTYWLYAVTLMVTGFAVVTTLTTANGYVQTTTDPVLRGRVMALYMAILMGGTPIGAPIVGWVAAEFGPRVAILLGAAAALVAFAIGATWMLASGRVRRHESRRFRLTIDETLPIRGRRSGARGVQRRGRLDDPDPPAADERAVAEQAQRLTPARRQRARARPSARRMPGPGPPLVTVTVISPAPVGRTIASARPS